jgi:hypothetical protein
VTPNIAYQSYQRSIEVKLARIVASLVVVLGLVSSSQAARIFLSSSATDPAAPAQLTLQPGGTGNLYLWATPDTGKIINGLGLSLGLTTPGVAHATSNSLYNAINENIGSRRWDGATNDQTNLLNAGQGLTDDPAYLIKNMNLVSVQGTGLNRGAGVISGDPNAVPSAFSYLVAAIGVSAGNPGSTGVRISIGDALVTIRNQGAATGLRLGDGTTDVSGATAGASDGGIHAQINVVPEPSTIVLALAGAFGVALACRRRS